jgi:hypothetical protein
MDFPLMLPVNVRREWVGLRVTNTPAYYGTGLFDNFNWQHNPVMFGIVILYSNFFIKLMVSLQPS